MTINLTEVSRRLGDAYHVLHHGEVDSTNDEALQLAREGAPGGTLVATEYQRAGRGRRGACWVAPPGSSVLMSLLLRPAQAIPSHHLAILTGVGAALGLRALDMPVKVKWPNDLMLTDRKVAGILVETLPDAVVVGIGINCSVPDEAFPDDVRMRAGSLHTLTGLAIRREDVLVTVAQGIADAMARVEAGGIIKVLRDWNTMNWFSRRKVLVTSPLGVVEGDGIFLDGRSLVFHVFKNAGVVPMPLSSSVEAR